ncbi:MAG: ATP-binding protein [Cyclobacteriaceae bacterium]|nr:ATP-binding protein [Cyclobacteriaceae bacterium]
MNSIKIEIPSLTENIRIIESFIDNAKDEYNIDDDIYGNIMIAVTESVNNAIRHGNDRQNNKNVLITLHLEQNIITFTVQDQGEGFDYENLPDPTSPENIDKPGGRGIFLMKHLADEVKFRDEGRIVQLSFYVTK